MRNILANFMRPFYANPVVARDLRVQMRGVRSYAYQGLYLAVLSLLAVIGYYTSLAANGTSEQGISVVDAQSKLQGFYYFIFYTLAALICLIAPALTASSITTERQRLTLDLLLTTPLSSTELLFGKLLSSVAFLALLLALSLPASTLCVLLGGATLGDVFRVYFLLAIDGLALAAIGLYCSAALKKGSSALGWTYASVIFYVLFTFQFSISVGTRLASDVFASLNPFLAVVGGGSPITVAGLRIPSWIGTAFLDLLIIRVLVTAATYRLGNYGGNPVGSFRRQLLVITGIALYGFAQAVASGFVFGAAKPPPEFMFGLAALIIYAIPFLPSLFTPIFDADSNEEQEFASYRISQAFRPDHSGALPFFHIWLLTAFACIYGLGWHFSGTVSKETLTTFIAIAFYVSGIGFLFWAIARRAGTYLAGTISARSLAFGAYILVALTPALGGEILGVKLENNPFTLSYPFLGGANRGVALLAQGIACYALSVLVFPFWKKAKFVKRSPRLTRKQRRRLENQGDGT